MRKIESVNFEVEIDSMGEAMDDTAKTNAELKRLLQLVIAKLDDEPEEEGWRLGLRDINGNPVGAAYLNIEEKDWISDSAEWIEHCKEYIEEHGLFLQEQNALLKDWDAIIALDDLALTDWFNNYTDSAISNEEVCPEASNWSYD